MTARPCPLDGAELRDHETICRGCARLTETRLRAIPELLDELDTSLARIGSTWTEPGGIRGRASGGCKPGCDHDADSSSCVAGVSIDVNLLASEAAMQLATVLYGWARVWDEETPIPTDDGIEGPMCRIAGVCEHRSCLRILGARQALPRRRVRDRMLSTTRRQAILLSGQPLAGRAWAPDLAAEIRDAVRQAERAIDRAPDVTLAGTCACGMVLYAQAGAKRVTCRWCSASYDYDGSRAAMLAELPQAYEHLLPKPEIAQLVGIPVGTLHRWSSEGRIKAEDVNEKGQPLYLLGPIAKAVQQGVPPERPPGVSAR